MRINGHDRDLENEPVVSRGVQIWALAAVAIAALAGAVLVAWWLRAHEPQRPPAAPTNLRILPSK